MADLFDWNAIEGIRFKFKGNSPYDEQLDTLYSTILDDTDTEDLFVESTTTDAKVLAPAMMTNLRGSVVNAITYPLPHLTELQKGHITQLLSSCAVYYIAPNGDSKKVRGPVDLEKAAKEELANHTDDSSKPSITIELLITTWKFKPTWKAQLFDKMTKMTMPHHQTQRPPQRAPTCKN
eukprot:jgi/Psemu1/41905/gm1.41905_g